VVASAFDSSVDRHGQLAGWSPVFGSLETDPARAVFLFGVLWDRPREGTPPPQQAALGNKIFLLAMTASVGGL
jgi:hypothetical protein